MDENFEEGAEHSEEYEYQSVDVPKMFYSDATGERFLTCTMCGKELLQNDTPYLIEKAFKVHHDFNFTDTVFEYAICMHCHLKMQQHISKESKKRMAEFFSKNTDLMGRMLKFYKEDDFGVDSWLSKCIVKDTDRAGLREYQVSAQFVGDKMVFTEFPIMLSGEAVDELVQLLSPETLGEMDDFTDRFLGLPPEFKKALKDRDVVLV